MLVGELFGRANLVLLDANGRVDGAWATLRRAGRTIARGERYETPAGGPLPRRSEDDAVADGDSPSAEDEPFPLSRSLEERYAKESVEARIVARRERLRVDVGRELRRRSKALRKMDEELAAAEGAERFREIGELLKSSLHQVARGASSVELVDYFDPAMPNVRIDLDPRRSPADNVERWFRKYRKAQRGRPILEERRDRFLRELATLQAVQSSLDEPDVADGDLDALEARARPLVRPGRREQSRATSRTGRGSGAAAGPRRFLSRDGVEILVGRNARRNDELTFRTARGNDLFFHVAGRPGSHVIARTSPRPDAPLETLLDAAILALYYSTSKRSPTDLTGAAADVDYTPVKYVTKPKGAKPGLVLLARHRTVRVQYDAERMARLRGSAEGAEAPSD